MSPVGPYRVKVSRRCPPDVVYVRFDVGPDIKAECVVDGALVALYAGDKWSIIASRYATLLPILAALHT